MTRLVLNPENDRSFLIKSIEIESHGYLEIGSYLRDP